MCAGHHPHTSTIESAEVEKALNDHQVQAHLKIKTTINRDYDIPYLSGYSTDGSIIYIDRHLPAELNYDPFLEIHEHTEKAVIDGLGYKYSAAHEVATACERRALLEAGLNWNEYTNTLKPYIKADEHEKLQSVPADLDLTPYESPPINQQLLQRLKQAQG